MRGLTFLGWFSMLGSAAALRAYTVLCWCALVALMVWVAMQWWVPAPVVAPALSREPSAQYRMDQSAETRLLGIEQAGAATPPSVKVVGLFANAEGRGAAVLSVDGLPAVSRQVGQEVSNGWVLVAVSASQLVLERQGLRHSVDLPIQGADPAMLVRVPAAHSAR